MLPAILSLVLSCTKGEDKEELPSSQEPSSEPTGLEVADSYTVAGELQTLFSADDSLWSISRFAGRYGVDERFDVQKIVGKSYETKVFLPNAGQRSYTWTGPVQFDGDEIIAALYTSNSAFPPQDGRHQGVVFFDTDGNLIADHDLYGTHGVTGPSGFAVDPETQNIYILANNSGNVGSPDDIVDFGSSAIIEITDPYRENPEYRKISLDGFKNASAIAFRDGRLIVAAANNTMDETSGEGKMLTVDPATEEILNIIDLPMGVGINGNAPSSDRGELIFTGNNNKGESLAVVDTDDTVSTYSVPSGLQSFVAGAQLVGSRLLFNVNQPGNVQTILLNPSDGTYKSFDPLGVEPDLGFGVAPIELGGGVYCDGADGTDISADGTTLYSQINCYQAVSE